VGSIKTVPDIQALPWNRALEVGTIDREELIRPLTEAIQRKLEGRVTVINTRSLLGEGQYYWAEVYRAGSNKGTGLRALFAEYGMDRSDLVAIGDNYNDLAMFELATCSVAMGNSPDDVKDKADVVTDHVAQGGAARVLESIAAGSFPCN
jgi:hydroxymethylpyrimidine pyrophosphatase-like HAD family hydrolase